MAPEEEDVHAFLKALTDFTYRMVYAEGDDREVEQIYKDNLKISLMKLLYNPI